MLTQEQKDAIRAAAISHAKTNIAYVGSHIEGIKVYPADSDRNVKLVATLADGTFSQMTVYADTFLDDKKTHEFVAGFEPRVNEALAKTIRFEALREVLLGQA